jgi:uroporphyrinogen III methyltransferase / synthase
VRIVVTRPQGQNEELARRLRELGHDVVCTPLIAIEPLGDEPIDVGDHEWVIVTSVNSARELRRRMRGRPRRVAAVGRATAEAFGGADLVPRVSTQEGLLDELPRPTGSVLFAGAEGARRLLVEELGAHFLPLYRTRELVPEHRLDGDLVVLASPSAARAYAALGLAVPAVTIGPETTAAARGAGVTVVQEARTHDLEGLVDAVRIASG